ncbi:MAG: CBS domain-containing protein [Sandaracinaceae bacterium]|nr:CBS domain-containing protein [Sandaracinaceae bacterium]
MSSALDALGGAIASLGEVRLLAAVEAGGRDGRTAARLLEEAGHRRTRLAVGRVLGLVSAVALTMHLTWGIFPPWGTALGVAAVAFTQAAVAAGLGAAARARATTWALPMARLLRPFELLVWPFSIPVHLLATAVGRAFESPPDANKDDEHTLREVEHMIEKREESGSITEEFAELLLSVFEFKDTVAREVMVPRTQMRAFELGASLDEVVEMIERHGHSRYPVYRDTLDRIEGILYAKDLFRILREGEQSSYESLRDIIRRPVFFVAETQKIGQLLREMQSQRFHLAVVADEFGGTSGIVTLEDILEEIVGEIQDEHDAEEMPIRQLGERHLWVDASVSVYDVAHVLDADLDTDEGDYDSVGGMIVERAGRVPVVGESLFFRGFEFIVRASDERHVTEVEIVERPHADGPEHAAAE